MADNVLGILFGDIADAIRSKTGDTAKIKPADFPEKIASIQGGGATETDILPLQDLTFTQNAETGLYEWFTAPAPKVLTVGETYHVVWGEKEYTVTGIDGSAMFAGAVYLGNLGIYGGADTGEPFIFAYIPAIGEGVEYDTLGCLTLDNDATHSVRIYQKSNETESGNKNFLLTSGKVTVDNESATITVAHGHGRVPDIIYIYSYTTPSTSTVSSLSNAVYLGGVQYSRAMLDAMNSGKKDEDTDTIEGGLVYVLSNSLVVFGSIAGAIDNDYGGNFKTFGAVRDCNEHTFVFGGGSITKLYRPILDNVVQDNEYTWYAISGIT